MGSLTEDPAFLATTFVVIDFESTTPAGYPAQPIEVAALALRYRQGAWHGPAPVPLLSGRPRSPR